MANGNGNGEVARLSTSPTATFRDQVQRMNSEIRAALPPHVPVERFIRVVLTAVNENPKLLEADRRSLLASCLRAAADGLLADGRDGALVIYNVKQGQGWIKKVQFLPMIGGLMRKARNSGDIRSIEAHVVYERDRFLYVLGDNPRLEHEPDLEADDPGPARFAYAIAWLTNGSIIREVMTRRQIEQVRAASKAGDSPDGPWRKWYDEMARKSVFRRLYKYLPKSSDLDDLVHREEGEDDQASELAAAKAAQVGMFKPVSNPLADEEPEELPPPAAFSDEGSVDPETGEIEEIRQEPRRGPPVIEHGESGEHAQEPEKPAGEPLRKVKPPSIPEEPPSEELFSRARESGEHHGRRRIPKSAMPKEFKEAHRAVFVAWTEAYERGRASASPIRPKPEEKAEQEIDL